MTANVKIAKWTLQQYHQMIAAGILEGQPVELLHGEIIEMSPEGEPHAFYSRTNAKYLEQLLGNRAEVLQGKPITISATQSEPEPDIAIVQPLGREYLQHHPYPENIFWVMEYANTSFKKDSVVKATAYAAAGIPEYWIVNLQTMELIVMRRPVQQEYTSQFTLTTGTLSPVAFPDIPVSVPQLLD
ncbi:Uma2 family endonuclease [Oscillatoria sp. CS-180]|uniref:Uma2 family endonuclease n=1 Tax=Oscillatoria sp. CS-180 TaxID=3021720 RepID=UPI00232CB627|nr:Uma2 family endonuclease [Oscillatoria sp. CS-180]MDB9526130.1 Uma2 family endonuclease [Oscillatoria sp. CS-180]